MQFEIIGEIKEIKTFASGNGRRRKCKGVAWIKLNDENQLCLVELH